MSTSNLYAQKIFSEHPAALWALDENVGFLSLLGGTLDDGKNLANTAFWTPANCTVTDQNRDVFPYTKLDTYVSKIAATSSPATVTSTFTINANDDEFSICFYYFSENPYLTKLEVGYKDGSSATVWSEIALDTFYQWNFANVTVKKQVHTTDPNILLRFTGSGSSVFIHGLSVGKYADAFAKTNLGVNKELMKITSDVATTVGSSYGVSSQRYASTNNNAYYVVDDNDVLLARQSFPMVYGSSNSVTILPSSTGDMPGLILPGYKFLDNGDKYKTRTFEAWLRIRSSATEPKRIFGPLYSSDGLYVHDSFLMLKVGSVVGSHHVGEWDRPMLVHIVSSLNSVKLFVNAEPVVSLQIDTKNTDMSYHIDDNGNDDDWLGFYAYSDVQEIDVDCVAIYNYAVDKEKALFRYGYGQAIDYPDNIIAAHDGKSIVPDYSLANYPNNHNYGNNQPNSWNLGTFKNMIAENSALGTPRYYLPTVMFSPSLRISQETYYSDLTSEIADGEPCIMLRPNSEYSSANAHISFISLNPANYQTSALYLVAERTEVNTAKQTLIKIYEVVSGNYYEVYIKTTSGVSTIYHEFYYNGILVSVSSNTASAGEYNVGTKFTAGLIVRDFLSGDNGEDLQSFFLSSNLQVYVGGTEQFSQTFTGKIYNVSFDTEENETYSLPALDVSDAPFYYGSVANAEDHSPTFGIIANRVVDKITLDIWAKSYWTDSVPLSLLSTYAIGSTTYDVDYLQVNFDYPKPTLITDGLYDTSNSSVKLYVSFQELSSTEPVLPSELDIVKTPESNVIVTNDNWETSVYDVVDGTIIYPPQIDGKEGLKMVLHIDSDLRGVNLKPIEIKTLQIAAQTMRRDGEPHTFGVKFGTELEYYGTDSEETSALIFSKTTEPYYYMSSKSGIKIAGTFDSENEHGYKLILNKDEDDDFNINSLQMMIRYSEKEFPATEQLLFRINAFDPGGLPEEYLFYIVENTDTSSVRGKIVAKYSLDGDAESELSNVKFFYNGAEVNDITLLLNEWANIGINFTKTINIDENSGSIDFCGPMNLATFAYTQTTGTSESTPISISNRWIDVLYPDASVSTWSAYNDTTDTWSDIVAIGEVNTGVVVGFDSEEMYQTYSGTARIVGEEDETKRVITESHRYKIYIAESSTNTLTRVV